MGNLKNKNLYGDEIASQASSITRNSTEDEDDGVADDIDDDIEVASNVPTCGEDTVENADVGDDNDHEDAPLASRSTMERARRSRTGPNFSRSREIAFDN